MKLMLQTWRSSPAAAHVAPFAVFMAFLAVPGWFRVENPELPWHVRAPELWVYPLQTLVCAGLLLFFRRHYALRPWRGLGLACALGVAGIALWILPAWTYQKLDTENPPVWWAWLGMADRSRGFDPGQLAEWPVWERITIFMRFARLVVVVPLVEEIFWRGFLMRWLAAEGRPWHETPFGAHTWRSFWIVTTLVMLAHQPADWPAAFVWGALVYLAAARTRSLGACVLMHALANALLGAWVMGAKQWGFW
ncbi:MAG TPA: CAAX prenyl protease-related protein [Verrucomicrobiales bacterium]|nr:CAAX prenyl protease-related protein [Verrucomicrobiales bacterium]